MKTTPTEPWEGALLALLDGPYQELRDDNHVTPNEVLVFDEAVGTVEALDLMDLPLRYPVGTGGRWPAPDLTTTGCPETPSEGREQEIRATFQKSNYSGD